MPTDPTERLDIEDDHQRELRLRQLLERINDSTGNDCNNNNNNNNRSVHPALSGNNVPFSVPTPGPSVAAALPSPSASFDFGVRQTHAVEPPRELLARLDEFLPQMEAANADLARRMGTDPESVDIEHLEDDAEGGQVIEMNLGLGVFDIKRRPTSERTGTHPSTRSSSKGSSSSTSTSSEDSNSSSEDDASHSGSDSDASNSVIGGPSSTPPAHRPIRPLPNRARPRIVVLGESTNHPPPSEPPKTPNSDDQL